MFGFHSKLPSKSKSSSGHENLNTVSCFKWVYNRSFSKQLGKACLYFSNHKPSIYVVIKWWIWPLQLAGTLEISEWNPPIVNDCFDLHGQQNNFVVYYKKVQVLLLLLDETHTNMSCPPAPWVKKASFCKIHKVTRQTCLHVWEAGKLWDDITWLSSNNGLTVRDGVSTVGLVPLGRGALRIQHGTLLGSWLKPSVTAWREESRGGEKVGGCCWWWWAGGDTECESQCDWFQIEKKGEGPLFCQGLTLHPAQSVGEGSSGPQPRRTMKALQA